MKHLVLLLLCVLSFNLWGLSARAEEAAMTQSVPADEHGATAGLLTIVNIPVRGVLCGMGSLLASIVMAASAGRRYADAASMMEESCTGPWVITSQMVSDSQESTGQRAPTNSLGYSRP